MLQCRRVLVFEVELVLVAVVARVIVGFTWCICILTSSRLLFKLRYGIVDIIDVYLATIVLVKHSEHLEVFFLVDHQLLLLAVARPVLVLSPLSILQDLRPLLVCHVVCVNHAVGGVLVLCVQA